MEGELEEVAEEDVGGGVGFGDVHEELCLLEDILRDGCWEQDESLIVVCFGRWWWDDVIL